jgi:Sugar (and other) transporter
MAISDYDIILSVDRTGCKLYLLTEIILQTILMAYMAALLTAFPPFKERQIFTGCQKYARTGAAVEIFEVGWTMGWTSIQYLLNAEIYPLRIKTTSSSMAMCFHPVNQHGNSKTVLIMLFAVKGGITNNEHT